MAPTIEIDFATKTEFNMARGLLDRQVSQANAVFMIADKCENYCREIEKQFQDLQEQFATKPDMQTLLKVESNFHNYTTLDDFLVLKDSL